MLLNYDYRFSWLLASLTMEQINLHAYNERSEGGRAFKKSRENEGDIFTRVRLPGRFLSQYSWESIVSHLSVIQQYTLINTVCGYITQP